MSTELARLLTEAVPEPPRGLDAAALLARARRRRRRTRAAGGVLAAGAVVALVLGGATLGDREPRATPPAGDDTAAAADASGTARAVPTTYAVLNRREPLPSDVLPGFGDQHLVHPGEGSPAGRAGTHDVYLARTREGGLCIVARDSLGGPLQSSCAPLADQLTLKGPLTFSESEDGDTWMVLPVPDGYTRAAAGELTVEVRDNVAIIPLGRPRPGTVVVSGPGLPTVDVRFDAGPEGGG